LDQPRWCCGRLRRLRLDPRERGDDLRHGLRPQVRVVGEHHSQQNGQLIRHIELVDPAFQVADLEVAREQLDEDFGKRPDVTSKIERPLVDDVRVAAQELLQHRGGPVEFGVDEARELVVDLDFGLLVRAPDHHDIVQDQVRDEMPVPMQHGEDFGHLVKQVDQQASIGQPARGEQGSPTLGVDPFADAIPQAVLGATDGMVADKALVRQLFQLLELALQPGGHLRIHAGGGGEKADHDVLVSAFADGAAQEGGVAFVEDIDDAVVVDGAAAFGDPAAAGGAGGDSLRYRLTTDRAGFHGSPSAESGENQSQPLRLK
jgi:hypothetical protein